MSWPFLFFLVSIGSGSAASAAFQEKSEQPCQETEVPVAETLEPKDAYHGAHVEGNQRRITFKDGKNPVAGQQVVGVQPLYSAALLSDGSVIQFVRDHKRDGSIEAFRRTFPASCVSGGFGFDTVYRRNGTQEIILSKFMLGRGRELLRLQNYRGHGLISRVIQRTEEPDPDAEEVTLLIEANHPIDGFGVSPPSIEGGWRSLMTVTQEEGSLIVGSYAYAIRAEDLINRSLQ